MKKIVTIGWWNGHSHMLSGLKNSKFYKNISLKSIVSMSDDGRTTGNLMEKFQEALWIHLPPPWDLRRCLYSLSNSKNASELSVLFETEISISGNIANYSLSDMLDKIGVSNTLKQYLQWKNWYFLDFILPIDAKIASHKFWNILMASMYHNYLYDYNYMIRVMHHILEVDSKIIPVTIDSAFIEALLDNWEIVKKQDNISNSISYTGRIIDLRLMNGSKDAKHNYRIDEAILEADYIVIAPWDLYTSTISNLIIWNIAKLIQQSRAKIIFVWNTTNKWWETYNYTVLDFVLSLEKYLGKEIDYLVANKKQLQLWKKLEKQFKQNISVKWGDYIFLTEWQKKYFTSRWTNIIESNLVNEESLYKHNQIKLTKTLEKIIF